MTEHTFNLSNEVCFSDSGSDSVSKLIGFNTVLLLENGRCAVQ